MAGNTQPVDITSAGTPLNPPKFKTYSSDPYGAQATQVTPATFFTANLCTTGTSTATNAGGSIRSFDFIKDQLVGSNTQLGG